MRTCARGKEYKDLPPYAIITEVDHSFCTVLNGQKEVYTSRQKTIRRRQIRRVMHPPKLTFGLSLRVTIDLRTPGLILSARTP